MAAPSVTHQCSARLPAPSSPTGVDGKGIAEVASEVKSPANEASSATQRNQEQVGAIRGATSNVVNAIQFVVTSIA